MNNDTTAVPQDGSLLDKIHRILQGTEREPSTVATHLDQLLAELKIQNDELHKSRQRLEEEHMKYLELYDSAPVGYFTFDNSFIIMEANLTAAKLLGVSKSQMIQRPLAGLIAPGYHNTFYSHRVKILKSGERQICELKFKRRNGSQFFALLESIPIPCNDNGSLQIRSTLSDISEQKHAEIRYRDKLIQTSIETMIDSFVIFRARRNHLGKVVDFVYEYINESGCRSLQLPRDKIVGNKLLSLLPEYKNNGIFDDYCEVMETGLPKIKEYFFYENPRDKSGIISVYDSRISKLQNGIVVTWRDILERIKTEKKLQDELKHMELLSAISKEFDDLSFDCKALVEKTVRRTAEYIGDTCIIHIIAENDTRLESFKFHNPDEAVMKRLRESFSNAEIMPEMEMPGHFAEGNPLLIPSFDNTKLKQILKIKEHNFLNNFPVFSFLAVPLRAQGKVIGVLILTRNNKENPPYTLEDQMFLQQIADISAMAITNARLYQHKMHEIEERRQAEAQLAEKEALLRDVLEFIPVGVWVMDDKSRLIIANHMVKKIWGGLKFDEKTGFADYKAWWTSNGERIPEQEWASLKAARGETILNEELLIECFDGTYKTILNSSVPILRDGKILGAIVTNVDITEIKDNEEKLKHLLLELERSNNELEQFAYVASHDLQEPIRMVSSYTQLLANRYKGKLDEKANEYIEFAVDGARRMQILIRDLLKYSRVTSKAKPFEAIDCNEIIYDILSDLQLIISENRAVITHENMPEILGDPTQIRQLLQNLIINGIKFRGDRNPEIHIRAVRNQRDWIFSVSDNGIGIEQQFFDRIFMLFQRLHEKEKYPGTGIGLAICKKIVERHGGRIWLESEPEQGTTFYFTLPLSKDRVSSISTEPVALIPGT
ncbi:MAG: ATP-binding protein [Ignavibacteriales bacterium]